jgi:transposase-like protein
MNEHVAKIGRGRGRPTKYDPACLPVVRAVCQMGATIEELADALSTNDTTIYRWRVQHPEFGDAMRVGKEAADAIIERTLYERARAGEQWAITKWLNNRMPREWGSNPADPGPTNVNIDARQQVI